MNLIKKYKNGITFSAFDLLHPGHIHFLKECKYSCSHLTVGLHVDPSKERSTKNKPIQSVYERYLQLEACKYVNKIIPYETEQDIINIICTNNQLEARYLGEDYLPKHNKPVNFTGQEECRLFGITIVYITRQHSYSSTELRNRILNESKRKDIK